ncbi:MAG: branched-chain amino acid aminotransferase [Planctomycetota bacterium]|jgi:branched-chain amino acid aminotransferase
MTQKIKITNTENSVFDKIDFNNLTFGKDFTDHMFIADYYDGKWQDARIEPFANFSIHPATSFIHYGQSIFEGLKASKNANGETIVFRPEMNIKRMNISARRMAMAEFPEDLFIDALEQLLSVDDKFIPTSEGSSMYIRPFCFATEEVVKIKRASSYRFAIILSPVGTYYSSPVKVYASEKYVRAFPGGTGFTKSAGNYGGAIYPVEEINKMGYDQILWLDGVQKKYVQEIGTMNFAVVIDGKVLTADLTEGTILPGITRDTTLTILKEWGIPFEERPISIDEIIEAHANGTLEDAFGMGTAAAITYIDEIGYRDMKLTLPPLETRTLSKRIKEEILKQRQGQVVDTHNWLKVFKPVTA